MECKTTATCKDIPSKTEHRQGTPQYQERWHHEISLETRLMNSSQAAVNIYISLYIPDALTILDHRYIIKKNKTKKQWGIRICSSEGSENVMLRVRYPGRWRPRDWWRDVDFRMFWCFGPSSRLPNARTAPTERVGWWRLLALSS